MSCKFKSDEGNQFLEDLPCLLVPFYFSPLFTLDIVCIYPHTSYRTSTLSGGGRNNF
jgi:hypothetical protein